MEPDLIVWAREEAERLRSIAGEGITMDSPAIECSVAVAFLETYAPRSSFVELAKTPITKGHSWSHSLRVVAGQLDGWADFTEAGFASQDAPALRARVEAATDLMEQVELLLADCRKGRVHPVAPVLLAGAALEELLRGMVAAAGLTLKGKPSITSYANTLRAADLISAQDAKEVLSLAGLRNDAAHGHFDAIEAANADLMAQRVNLFMQQRGRQER